MRFSKIIIVCAMTLFSSAIFSDVLIRNMSCPTAIISYYVTIPSVKLVPMPVVLQPNSKTNSSIQQPNVLVAQKAYQPIKNYSTMMVGVGGEVFLPVKHGFSLISDAPKQSCSVGTNHIVTLIKTSHGCQCE